MPTEPVFDLLPGERSDEVQRLLETLADGIAEVVRFGTHVFVWHSEASAGRRDEVVPVAMMLRHLLEMLDAVSALVRASIIEPAHLPLRSAFEAAVQIEWIIQSDSDRRGMAFMVWHAHHRIKLYRQFDRAMQQGKELAAKLTGTVYDGIDASGKFDLPAARANMESVLIKPHYQEAAHEYHKLQKERKRSPQWFQLFGGPDSLEQLASRVGMPEWYQILYRQWSGVAHATDVITGKLSGRDGGTAIQQLRWPGGVEGVYNFSVSLALRTFRHLIAATVPEKQNEMRDWYIREVRPLYQGISGRTIIVEGDT